MLGIYYTIHIKFPLDPSKFIDSKDLDLCRCRVGTNFINLYTNDHRIIDHFRRKIGIENIKGVVCSDGREIAQDFESKAS